MGRDRYGDSEDMRLALGSMELIVTELGKINKNIEKFLKRDEYRLKNPPMGSLLPPFTSDELDSMFRNLYCSWCMAEINYRGNEKFTECSHATLCMACAPCDECLVEEN